jgi:amino acid transporter
MRWYDGVVLSLTIPAALVATLGYSVGALGTWSAIVLWGVSMLIATAANWIYTELAGMFPERSGGISLYGSEAFRSRLSLVGPLVVFGYWFAWSSSIAVYSEIAGDLVRAEWFPGQDWSLDAGPVDLTFGRVVALGIVVVVWAANVLGLRPTMRLAYVAGALLLVPIVVFMFVPYLTGDWSSESFTWKLGEAGQEWGGWKLATVWLYVMLWTSLGVEVCATFTPEYRRGVRDASRALRAAALLSLGIFVLLPLGALGVVGEAAAAADPITFYAAAFEELLGVASGLMIALLVAGLVLVITTCFAGSSRALYGMSREGLTLRGIDRLNRHGVPGRALTVDLVVNLCLILFVGGVLAILAASNLGYLLAHVAALTSFLLLRRDRPGSPRAIRLGKPFLGLAALLVALLFFVLVVGATSFSLTGYGGLRELLVALGILLGSLVLFVWRRVVQERGRLRLREIVEAGAARTHER